MLDSCMLVEFLGMVRYHEGKLGKVLIIHIISKILKIPNEHGETQAMSPGWCILLIVYWQVTEIQFLSCWNSSCSCFFHFLLYIIVEVTTDLLPSSEGWLHLVEEREEVGVTAQEIVKLFLELCVVQHLGFILSLMKKLRLDDMNELNKLLVGAHSVQVHIDGLLSTDTDGSLLIEITSLQLFYLTLSLTLSIDLLLVFLA